MLNMEKNRSKITAMLVIAAMLASAFSIMGMTAEEAHAAAKAKKPAKVASLTAKSSANQYAKASWKKATKKVKVGKKRYKVNYQLKTTVKDIFGKTKTTNYNIKNATTSKTFYNNPGTKYTFKIRGYYTKGGKKVYGAWSTAKSATIPTNVITLESARTNTTGYVVAQANITGAQKYRKYNKFVFTFNGVQKTCTPNDYVIFEDLRAGTLTVHGEYTVNGKTVRTKTASKALKASNRSGGNNPTQPSTNPTTPTSGGGTSSGSDMNVTSDIKIVKDTFVKDSTDANNKNNFVIEFTNAVKSKYNWKVTALDNKRFRETLNLSSTDVGKILNADYHYIFNDDKHIEIQTNWQCTNICLEAYDKSTGKKVFSKNIGWDYTYNYNYYIAAPGNYSYNGGNGVYYKRCMDVVDYIIDKSGAKNVTGLKNKVNKIKTYTRTKFFLCVGYENSMNVKKNLGFFENEMYRLTGSCEYLDVAAYDYSKMLAYLLGVDGGDCVTFLMVETLIVKRLDSGAKVVTEIVTSGDMAGHAKIYAVESTTGTEVPVDLSGTAYRGGCGALYDDANREAIGLYNSAAWQEYFRGVMGAETAKYYGL